MGFIMEYTFLICWQFIFVLVLICILWRLLYWQLFDDFRTDFILEYLQVYTSSTYCRNLMSKNAGTGDFPYHSKQYSIQSFLAPPVYMRKRRSISVCLEKFRFTKYSIRVFNNCEEKIFTLWVLNLARHIIHVECCNKNSNLNFLMRKMFWVCISSSVL